MQCTLEEKYGENLEQILPEIKFDTIISLKDVKDNLRLMLRQNLLHLIRIITHQGDY